MAKKAFKPIINKDLAENARQMVEFGFWKYMDRFMDELVKESEERADSFSVKDAMDGHFICQSRAVRHTIKRIKDEVAQYL